jgi:E3 ubiquitin-protein ligase HUWE1
VRPQHASINALVQSLENAVADSELTPLLSEACTWTLPKTDLHHWIKVLNRFDAILEETCSAYGLASGSPQLNEFTPKTKSLVLAILHFTTALLEHATNKRTYASYDVGLAAMYAGN